MFFFSKYVHACKQIHDVNFIGYQGLKNMLLLKNDPSMSLWSRYAIKARKAAKERFFFVTILLRILLGQPIYNLNSRITAAPLRTCMIFMRLNSVANFVQFCTFFSRKVFSSTIFPRQVFSLPVITPLRPFPLLLFPRRFFYRPCLKKEFNWFNLLKARICLNSSVLVWIG